MLSATRFRGSHVGGFSRRVNAWRDWDRCDRRTQCWMDFVRGIDVKIISRRGPGRYWNALEALFLHIGEINGCSQLKTGWGEDGKEVYDNIKEKSSVVTGLRKC